MHILAVDWITDLILCFDAYIFKYKRERKF